MKNFIYVIVSENGLFKVGETSNVRARYDQINSSSPVPTQLFFWFEGSRKTEQDLHNIFDNLRVKGEWFALDRTSIEHIVCDFAHSIPQKNKAYILQLLQEMEAGGFFGLGHELRHRNMKLAVIYRCQIAMEKDLPSPLF